MPNLPTLTPAEIEAELKGTVYDENNTEGGYYWPEEAENNAWEQLHNDKKLNAARAIRLARENEELRAKLQAQHKATWGMAMTAVDKVAVAHEGITANALAEIRVLPCPPLETKGG